MNESFDLSPNRKPESNMITASQHDTNPWRQSVAYVRR